MKIIVGISGASGVVLGVRLVEVLADHEVVTIVTGAARRIMKHELPAAPDFLARALDENALDAAISSSSTHWDAMVVMPCSMKTLAGVALGYTDNLLTRAAETTLRMGRKLILAPRETPLSLPALENMARAARAGAIILPPVMAFYHRPETVADMRDFAVGKVLEVLNIDHHLYRRWQQ